MENFKIYNCIYCNYNSNRKYNLNIHEINKHSKEILNEKNDKNIECNFSDLGNINIENKCEKCYKILSTKYTLIKHMEKCNGFDKLTCCKCMKSFSSHQSKSNHMKRDNCKAKSLVYAKINNINNISNITNNIDNSIVNNTINNTYIINNYGNERLDYLSNEDMYKILTNINSIPLYIEKKHFNKDFPENHNIMYDDKSKRCKIKENNKWKTINLSLMSIKLINDNSNSLLVYFNKNKEELNKKIHNEELYYFILNKLLLIKNKNDKEKYNTLYNLIKFIIENNTFSSQNTI
jgi:hypothetical protein